MGNRISDVVLVLTFALVGLALAVLPNFTKNSEEPKASTETSDLDKIIQFCLDPKHKSSKLCIVKKPKSEEEVKEAVEESNKQESENRTPHPIDPIVVESETKTVEEKTEVQRIHTNSDNSDEPQPTPPQPAPKEDSQPVELPEIPKVEVPEVSLPDPDELLGGVTTVSK